MLTDLPAPDLTGGGAQPPRQRRDAPRRQVPVCWLAAGGLRAAPAGSTGDAACSPCRCSAPSSVPHDTTASVPPSAAAHASGVLLRYSGTASPLPVCSAPRAARVPSAPMRDQGGMRALRAGAWAAALAAPPQRRTASSLRDVRTCDRWPGGRRGACGHTPRPQVAPSGDSSWGTLRRATPRARRPLAGCPGL